MYITIWAGGMPFNGETIPSGKSLGGSESAAYYMAKELVARGHRVTIFTGHEQTGKWDGVAYEHTGPISKEYPLGRAFHFFARAPADVTVVQRHPAAFVRSPNSKLNALWLHDLALYRSAGHMGVNFINTDFVFTVSEFHKRQVCDVYKVGEEFVVATKNGVDRELGLSVVDGVPLPYGKRDPRSLFYAARPERGLENLVAPGGIMELLPDCHLYVCGYDNTVPQMRDYYRMLWARCEELPNVTNLGSLGKKELYAWMSKCMLYVYPTEFEDTSCIAAMEAQTVGTPFLSSKVAALPETLAGAGAHLQGLVDGRVDRKKFAERVRKSLEPERWQRLHDKAVAMDYSWAPLAEQWEREFEGRLAAKSSKVPRLYKHFEHVSDIVAATELLNKTGVRLPDSIQKRYDFFFKNRFKEHYAEVYQYEKDRGVVYGPESLENNARFEMVDRLLSTITERQPPEEALADNIKELYGKEKKPVRVLDYGCAHGHYVMNLRARHHDWEFVGVDIAELNIEAANKWLADEKDFHGSVEFRLGELGALDKLEDYKFDVIMVNEVLEHVPDPRELLNRLLSHLRPNGWLLGTTPYGPWEAIGYDQHELRAHIHHFERADLDDMFRGIPGYRLVAVPHSENLGHYIFAFQPGPIDQVKAIDYDRKLRTQAPRETVSFCLIAKDAEHSLGKTLQKVKPLADEIIVGVDETTKDDTWRVAEEFDAKCFAMPSPMQIGFDEARNKTIELAACDWVFWIDSDEILEYGERLEKYLRPNAYDGYAVKQHHLGVEPLGCSKTDLPVRLFRNHIGIRFFGMVHEHPSKRDDANAGVGRVIVAEDLAIMHTGYATEAVRRKRFMRNFPLMKKDREKYPDRTLGKFLWLRDLGHLIQYDAERNGGRITNQMRQYGVEIVEIWRWLIDNGHTRMAHESLDYYSRAVAILGGGMEVAFDVGASRGNGGARMQDKPTRGLFANAEDARKLMNVVMDDRTKVYEERYF